MLIFFVCSIRCEEGYQLATQMSTLSCQSGGAWSKHSIRCSPVPCPSPTNLSNPHVIITGRELTPVGGGVTLSCPPGLYLQGSALAECRVRETLVSDDQTILQMLKSFWSSLFEMCLCHTSWVEPGRQASHQCLASQWSARNPPLFFKASLKGRATTMGTLSCTRASQALP